MKDLLLIARPDWFEGQGGAAPMALALAKQLTAQLSVMVAALERDDRPPPPDNMQLGWRQEPAAAPIAEAMRRLGASAAEAEVTMTALDAPAETAALRAAAVDHLKLRDVALIDVFGTSATMRAGLVEAMLFGSGRPVIIVPPDRRATAIRKVLVGWDASRAAVRAIHDALPLLQRADQVTLLSIADGGAADLKPSPAAMTQHLARWGVRVEATIVRGERAAVAATLHAYATQSGCDLLVMGAAGASARDAFVFGSAARDMLATSIALPVLLSH
ncbi:universal stress protein [Bradyrhizobium sp. USDA 4353]